MSIADKLTTIAENEQKVYDAGYKRGEREGYCVGQSLGFQDGYGEGYPDGVNRTKGTVDNVMDMIEFNGAAPLTDYRPQSIIDLSPGYWEEFQQGGERANYNEAFRQWKSEYIYPLYPFQPRYGQSMFARSEIREGPDVDFSKVSYSGTTGGSASAFSNCQNLVSVGVVNVCDTNTRSMFNHSPKLKKIEKMIVSENTFFLYTFYDCPVLEEVIFEGTIGNPLGNEGKLNFPTSPNLSAKSIASVLTCLKDYSGTDEEFVYTMKLSDALWERVESYRASPTGGTWREYVTDKCWST